MNSPHLEALGLLASLERCMWITERGLRGFVARLQSAASAVLPLEALGASDALEMRGDGTAVIPIIGDIVPRASLLAERVLGVASVERIRSQFRAAMADPTVTRILFDVDSPGGFVSGVPDLADEIFAARGTKPMLAVANESAFSAAYYLAAQADRLVLSRTAGVGSIGVIAVHVDESALLERMGVKFTAVKAGAKKDQYAFWKELSPEAEAELQSQVDRSFGMFANAVAKARGMTAAAVRGFEAGTFYGSDAVQAGLADKVTPADQAPREFKRISQQRAEAAQPEGFTMAGDITSAGATAQLANTNTLAPLGVAGGVATVTLVPGLASATVPAPDLDAERAKWDAAQKTAAKARVAEIRDLFAGYQGRADLMALQADCIGDLDCSPMQASKKLLAALAASDAPEISNAQTGGATKSRRFALTGDQLFEKRAAELQASRSTNPIVKRLHGLA